jgi:orotidine-5'-phosphate decarboxylase
LRRNKKIKTINEVNKMADTIDKKYFDMARKRICLAIDEPDVIKAMNLSAELGDLVGMAKIGKEIHTAAGMQGINIVDSLYEEGVHIFLDLKFHDTPNTVYGASVAAVAPNVKMFNVHIAGGEKMCKKALEGARVGYELTIQKYKNNITHEFHIPKVIGVTVLTSLDDSDLAKQGLNITYKDLVRRRTELAKEWGLDGIVCPANAAGALEKEFGYDPNFLFVTPGIEWAGVHREGQKQLYTPDLAVKDCKNSVLVIGGAITKLADMTQRRQAAKDINYAMAAELQKQYQN